MNKIIHGKEEAKVEDISFLSDQRDPERRKMLLAERDQEYDKGVTDKYMRDTRDGRMTVTTSINNNNISSDQHIEDIPDNDLDENANGSEDEFTVAKPVEVGRRHSYQS